MANWYANKLNARWRWEALIIAIAFNHQKFKRHAINDSNASVLLAAHVAIMSALFYAKKSIEIQIIGPSQCVVRTVYFPVTSYVWLRSVPYIVALLQDHDLQLDAYS